MEITGSHLAVAAVAALVGFAVCFVAPAPRRPIHVGWALGCLCLWAAMSVGALAIAGLAGEWRGALAVFLFGCAPGLTAFWIAHAPWAHELDDDDEPDDDPGGGGGGGAGGPEHPRSPRPTSGIAPAAWDWEAFDRARAEWTRRAIGPVSR